MSDDKTPPRGTSLTATSWLMLSQLAEAYARVRKAADVADHASGRRLEALLKLEAELARLGDFAHAVRVDVMISREKERG